MFEKAVAKNREAIYAILASPPLPPETATPSGGTAFMIAPVGAVDGHRILRPGQRSSAPAVNIRVDFGAARHI